VPDQFLALGAVVLGAIVASVLLWDRRAIFFLAVLAPFLPFDYINRYYVKLPSAVKWLPFLLMAAAGLAAAVLLPKTRTWAPTKLMLAYGLLLAVFVVSTIANGSAIPALLVSQRGFVILLLAIVALKAGHRVYDKDDIYAFLVYAGLLSCALCVMQRLTLPSGVRDPGDRVTGLFSVGFMAMFFHLMCMAIVVAYWIQGKNVVRWSAARVLPAFLIALGVANQKAAVPYLLLTIGLLFATSGMRVDLRAYGKLIALGIVLPPVVLLVFAPLYDRVYEDHDGASFTESITNPEFVHRYLFGTDNEKTQFTPSGRLLRGRAIVFAYEKIQPETLTLALGLGPGATSESNVPGASGALARRYPGYAVDRVTLGMILADTGLLGLLAQLLFLAAIYTWKPPPGMPAERNEHAQIRKVFVALNLSFFVYANLAYEPIFALLVAVAVFPTLPARATTGIVPVGLRAAR
jgi:hypothetical protein